MSRQPRNDWFDSYCKVEVKMFGWKWYKNKRCQNVKSMSWHHALESSYKTLNLIVLHSWLYLVIVVPALEMSHSMTKSAKWPVRPVKTQISLGICPVWIVFEETAKTDQTRRLSLHWVQRSFCWFCHEMALIFSGKLSMWLGVCTSSSGTTLLEAIAMAISCEQL